jgi:ribulose-phosphate 3-epimerase
MALIAPSLLAADFARLGEALRLIKESGATMVHVDVMDGHFVPEISIGQPVAQSIRRATDLILDLHLLIERPERYVPEFLGMGADRIAVHAESTPNLHHVLKTIRGGGAKVGLALNTSTSVESFFGLLGAVDYLLILSADLGFETARFISKTVEKVRSADILRREKHLKFEIEVDGEIEQEQVEVLVRAGSDILVAGSNIFVENPQLRIQEMMRLAASSGEPSRN